MRRLLTPAILWLCLMSQALCEPTYTGEFPEGVPPPVASDVSKNPSVVGGEPTNDHRIVGVVFDTANERDRVCSGLYISAYRILTAAHCACNARNIRISNTNYAIEAFVRATVVSVFPGYDCSNPGYLPRGNDLALLAIAVGLPDGRGGSTCGGYTLLPNIRKVTDWFPNRPVNISVAGYGFNGDRVGTREEAIVTLNSMLCISRIAMNMTCTPHAEFVAGNVPRRGVASDTCGGDSGGPAFFRMGESILPVGIVSRALPVKHPYSKESCGAGGIYTHLGRSDVIQWLASNDVPQESKCTGALLTE